MIHLLVIILASLWLGRAIWLLRRRHHRQRRRTAPSPTQPGGRWPNKRKPDWVRHEVLRRKALTPDLSCRNLASGFNAEFRHKQQMTVGHSWVAVMVKKHDDEICKQRKKIKNRKFVPGPKNKVWGLDLTEVSTTAGPVTLLGAVDHGARACLALEALGSKATIQILRVLLDVIERFGKPKFVRTDNAAVFNSRRFR